MDPGLQIVLLLDILSFGYIVRARTGQMAKYQANRTSDIFRLQKQNPPHAPKIMRKHVEHLHTEL